MNIYTREDLKFMKEYLNKTAEIYFTSTFKSEEEKMRTYNHLVYLSEKVDKVIAYFQENNYTNIKPA